MPRIVDPHARRQEISEAAIRVLARGGTQALTLKSLAEELGGSITLVTHFFANRDELFVAITDDMIASYDAMFDDTDDGVDAYGRLRSLLTWMSPFTAEDIAMETGRIALIWRRDEHESIAHFFTAMEQRMRSMLRRRLEGLVPTKDLDNAVAYLRAVTNGLTLSAVEHPDLWPPERIEWVIDRALDGLGIAPIPRRRGRSAKASPDTK